MTKLHGFSKLFTFYLVLLLALPGVAFAADAGEVPNTTLPLPNDMIWALVAAALVPLGGYIVNFLGPQTSEKVKGLVQIVFAAAASGIVQAITAGGVGFNGVTAQYILFGLFAAFGAHKLIYKPTTIATLFGAGQNKPGQTPGPLQPPPA